MFAIIHTKVEKFTSKGPGRPPEMLGFITKVTASGGINAPQK